MKKILLFLLMSITIFGQSRTVPEFPRSERYPLRNSLFIEHQDTLGLGGLFYKTRAISADSLWRGLLLSSLIDTFYQSKVPNDLTFQNFGASTIFVFERDSLRFRALTKPDSIVERQIAVFDSTGLVTLEYYPDSVASFTDIRTIRDTLDTLNNRVYTLGIDVDDNANKITIISAVNDTQDTKINSNVTEIGILNNNLSIVSQQVNANEDSLAIHRARLNINSGMISSNVTAIDINANNISYNSSTIQQNADAIKLRVRKDSVVSSINLSSEGLRIDAGKIQINGSTVFASGYDPTAKIPIGGAASDINNHTTTITGDKIRSGLIQSNNWSSNEGSQFDLNNGVIRLGGSLSNVTLEASSVGGQLVVQEGSDWVAMGKNSTVTGIMNSKGDYWYTNGTFRFGGANGIRYDGSKTTFGSDVEIDGNLIVTGTITGTKLVNQTITKQQIAQSTIDSALIGTAAISSANIKQLSADKITTGELKSANWGTDSGIMFDLNNGIMYVGGVNGSLIQYNSRGFSIDYIRADELDNGRMYTNEITFPSGMPPTDVPLIENALGVITSSSAIKIRSNLGDCDLYVQGAIEASAGSGGYWINGVSLNFSSAPGVNKYYGTNSSGTIGYYDLPSGTDDFGAKLVLNGDNLVLENVAGQTISTVSLGGFSRKFVQSGHPSSSLGNVGDICIDTLIGTFYIKTSPTTWDEVQIK